MHHGKTLEGFKYNKSHDWFKSLLSIVKSYWLFSVDVLLSKKNRRMLSSLEKSREKPWEIFSLAYINYKKGKTLHKFTYFCPISEIASYILKYFRHTWYHVDWHQFQVIFLAMSSKEVPKETKVQVIVPKEHSYKQFKHLVAGGVAGAVSRTFVSPFERLKILLQVKAKIIMQSCITICLFIESTITLTFPTLLLTCTTKPLL